MTERHFAFALCALGAAAALGVTLGWRDIVQVEGLCRHRQRAGPTPGASRRRYSGATAHPAGPLL